MITRATVIAALAATVLFCGAIAAVVLAPSDDPLPVAAARADAAADPPAERAGGSEPKPSAEPRPPAAAAAQPTLADADRVYGLNTPPGADPVLAVRRGAEVEIHSEPGGGKVVDVVGKRTAFGSPTVFGVIDERDGWAGVSTAAVANGALGWVRIDPAVLKPQATRSAIVVDLSMRAAELREDGAVVLSFPVTVGMPGAETPTGRFAVTDTFRDDLGPDYGCCAVAISATQPNLPSGWLGGNRIAIHATDGPLGEAISHGCVRASDEAVSELVSRVPLGTPVFVQA